MDTNAQPKGNRSSPNECVECILKEDIIAFLSNVFENISEYHDTCEVSDSGSKESSDIWVSIVLVAIGIFGVIGNAMNLAVLTQRRLTSRLDRLERSSNYALFALAVSDLLICLVVIPHGFIMDARLLVEEDQWFILYYKVYGVALINLLMMVSMWQVVSMAVHRYMIVVYPMHVRVMLSKKKTFLSIAIVYTVSVILSSPHFIILRIDICYQAFEKMKYYEIRPLLSVAHHLQIYIRWVWPVLAVFIPAAILLVCNYRLVIDLHHTMHNRKTLVLHSRRRISSVRRTRRHSTIVKLTLVMVVLVDVFLVAPVEVIRYINPYELWGKTGHIIALTGNLLQAFGFASNFILYFVVNARFRQIIKNMFCFRI